MRILYTEQALESLDEAHLFLHKVQNIPIHKVEEILGQVVDSISLLKERPFKGQKEESLRHLNLEHRRLVVGHFKIIYVVGQESIQITDIFDSRQSPDRMKY